jgi:hypothetical protein
LPLFLLLSLLLLSPPPTPLRCRRASAVANHLAFMGEMGSGDDLKNWVGYEFSQPFWFAEKYLIFF